MNLDFPAISLDYLLRPKNVQPVDVALANRRPGHPGCRALLSYWESRKDADGIVRREHLMTRGMGPLLPHVFLADPGLDDWRYRLVGTGICAWFGRDITGTSARRLFGSESAEFLQGEYQAAVATGGPRSFSGTQQMAGNLACRTDGIFLPLHAAGSTDPLILGGVFFQDLSAYPVRPTRLAS